jgi:putative endonuclease
VEEGVAMANPDVGRTGEALAAAWYESNGFRILDRNWRTRSGELDLVATRHDLVVFCEVKTRTTRRFGTGADAVGWDKQRRVRAMAVQWLQLSDRHYAEVRFDVADVDGRGHVHVIEDCF